MKNLELKAKSHSLAVLRQRLVHLNARYDCTMTQIDTYFNVPKGRLKLREIDDCAAALIYYERSDIAESRYSNYQICPIPNPLAFKQMMSATLGEKVVVEKERELWRFGHTRVHLDRVVGLGEFVELETVIGEITEEAGNAEHQFVRDGLGIQARAIVSGSYSDMG